MSNFFSRQGVKFNNEMAQSCGALLGIAQGLLADGTVNDRELMFLRDWLANNDNIVNAWPGNAIYLKVQAILADGTVTDEERAHLTDTLQKLIGGTLAELAQPAHATELALDHVDSVDVVDRRFCLTGDFVYGTRPSCERLVVSQGGLISDGITKKLNYLVIGGLGSAEWKHGSFGTKIAKAMEYKQAGIPIKIVHEDAWVAGIRI